ncbi:GntR family transcriptional regulator [Rhodopila sp.]|uniref:GntR family transcriptional regulator n=1 Tax=Rhodopila sp. TaxID=2480087 RepID=UPI003D11DD02
MTIGSSALPEASGVSPLNRDPLYERVYQEVRRMLMEGVFAPGAELTLRSLSQAFGTSDMPVRDALRRLISEGALSARSNRSPIVRQLTREQFEEVRDVRMLIEGAATANACDAVSEPMLRAVRGLHRDLREAAETDVALHLNLNRRFHFTIYAACGMPLLVSMIEALWLQIGPLYRSLSIPLLRSNLPDYHHRIVRALEQRNAAAAAQAVQDDIASASAIIVQKFDAVPNADTAPELAWRRQPASS